MKKMFVFICIILTLPQRTFAYDTEYYTANLTNFIQHNENNFYDNDYPDSGITLTFEKHQMPTTLISHEDLYTQDSLNELQVEISKTLKNSFQSNNINVECIPAESKITKLSQYDSFYLYYKLEVAESVFYHMWIYEVFADNYIYAIMINSFDSDYINSNNVTNFMNSFVIKDTTSLCTSTKKTETSTITNLTNTEQSSQNNFTNYTFSTFIIDILLTAIIYLLFPLILRLGFKKSFSSMKALWISFANFMLIKIVLYGVILDTEINTYSAWWYLFIGQAILTRKKDKDIYEITQLNSEDNTAPIADEVLNILSDKERIKNILDDKEVIDESLFIGIENPFNNKKIENITDIKEYLYSFYLR